tara:strand:+ start:873 stop:1307 length:435 start_codon:yes stop_codon:yes gene_type:complete
MAKMDMFSNVDVDIALSNELYANGMDQNGLSVDMQGFESVVFEILAGVLATAGDTDGTYVLYLQEADEDPNNPGVPGAYTAVDQNFIQGGNFPADVAGKILEIDGTDADERETAYIGSGTWGLNDSFACKWTYPLLRTGCLWEL